MSVFDGLIYEQDVIELQFDIVAITINEFFEKSLYGDNIFHLNYNVIKQDFKKNTEEIYDMLSNHILHNLIEMPEEIKKADIIILLERKTSKILRIINKGFIKKDKIKDLIIINDINYMKFLLNKLLEDK